MPRSQRMMFSLPDTMMRSTQSRYASVSSELPRLVLAVRLADLQAVDAGVLVALEIGGIEDLDHRRQRELATRAHDELQALAERLSVGRAEPFPAAVRARAILDDAAAQRLTACRLHHAGGFHDLPLALHRARSGDENQIVAAAENVADLHCL